MSLSIDAAFYSIFGEYEDGHQTDDILLVEGKGDAERLAEEANKTKIETDRFHFKTRPVVNGAVALKPVTA